jgi:hypothetical protein
MPNVEYYKRRIDEILDASGRGERSTKELVPISIEEPAYLDPGEVQEVVKLLFEILRECPHLIQQISRNR